MLAAAHYWLAGWESVAPPTDTTAPVVNIASASASKISMISGNNQSVITWFSDEDFVEYQIRVVPALDSGVTAGALIEGGALAGTAAVNYQHTVTGNELFVASATDGSKIVKVFAKDAAGNWNSAVV